MFLQKWFFPLILSIFPSIPLIGKCVIPLYVGPEIYHIKRWRSGGTQQSGRMDGVRTGFDRIKRCGWYIGADGLYATGTINGHNSRGRRLDSDLTDMIAEIRGGYTLGDKSERRHTFTPFLGYGYFHETNDFRSPSPITYTFTDSFTYLTGGFLSGFNFTPLLSMGLNFKIKFMSNGKSQITDDPIYDEITLIMNDELQLRLDVPLTYCLCKFQTSLTPFYEYRHFGGRDGYPFNYIDTKFRLIGARIDLAYRF